MQMLRGAVQMGGSQQYNTRQAVCHMSPLSSYGLPLVNKTTQAKLPPFSKASSHSL